MIEASTILGSSIFFQFLKKNDFLCRNSPINLCMCDFFRTFAPELGAYPIPRKYIIEKYLKFLVKFFKL